MGILQLETCTAFRHIDDEDSSAMLSEALFNPVAKGRNDVAGEIILGRKI